MMEKLYYAHSMLMYGTKKERQELKQIKKQFPNHEIINPAKLFFTGNGAEKMQSYVNVVKQAAVIVFSEYEDYIGKGVFTEIEMAKREGIERYLLRKKKFKDFFELRLMGLQDWKIKYAKVVNA